MEIFDLVKFDNNEIQINLQDRKIFLRLEKGKIIIDGDFGIVVNGDMLIASKGEMQIASKDNDINIDSIDANIHLNSRIGKFFKNLPESIEYRDKIEKRRIKMIEENQKKYDKNHYCIYEELNILTERIEELEEKINSLKEK